MVLMSGSRKRTAGAALETSSQEKSYGSEKAKYLSIAVVTTSEEDKGNVVDGSQVFRWCVAFQASAEGVELAKYVDRIILQLHESFEVPTRILKEPPFEVREKGWGEFDIDVTVHFKDPNIDRLRFKHPLSFELSHMKRDIKTSCKIESVPLSMSVGRLDGAVIESLANRLCQLDDIKIRSVVQRVQSAKNSKAAIVAYQEPPLVDGAEKQDGVFTFDLYALEEKDLLDLCDIVGLEHPA